MVTRTFKMMERRCKVYDKESDSVKEETFIAKITDKNGSHILKNRVTFFLM